MMKESHIERKQEIICISNLAISIFTPISFANFHISIFLISVSIIMARDFADMLKEEFWFFACTIVAFNYKSMNVKSGSVSVRLLVEKEVESILAKRIDNKLFRIFLTVL